MRTYQVISPSEKRGHREKYCYSLELIGEKGERLLIRNYTNEDFKYEEGALNSLLKKLGEEALQYGDIRIIWRR